MENIDSDQNEKLFNLLSAKIFSSLSENEKKFVSSQMSENEYNDVHFLQMESTKMLNTDRKQLAADPTIKDNLIYRMKIYQQKKEKDLNPILALFFYRLPVYQMAIAAIIVMVSISMGLRTNSKSSEISSKIIYRNRFDTVYLEKPLARLIEKTKPFSKPKHKSKANRIKLETPSSTFQPSLSNTFEELQMQNNFDPVKIAQATKQGFSGYSILDDSAVASFLVKMY